MPTHIHGSFLNIFETGVLIAGPSGIGKSKLALTLIQQGHALVADDIIEFSRTTNQIDQIEGCCPQLLQDFLATRSLGILNVRRLYGDTAICQRKQLQMIINLTTDNPTDLIAADYLQDSQMQQEVLDVAIPAITIPIAPGFNLATLVEVAVRNYQLQQMGYNASVEFSQRQQALLT